MQLRNAPLEFRLQKMTRQPILIVTNYLPDDRDKKVQVGNDQEKAQPENDSHSKNRVGKKNYINNQVLIP